MSKTGAEERVPIFKSYTSTYNLVQSVGILFFLFRLPFFAQSWPQKQLSQPMALIMNNSVHDHVRPHLTHRELNDSLNEVTIIKFSETSGSTSNKCSRAALDLDRCSAQLIAFGQSSAVLPSNLEELNSVYCPNFKRVVSCIKNSTDCFKPFEKQIIDWVLGSTRRMNYKRCKNENEKQRFLKLTSSCSALMDHPMDKCMSKYISSLEGIAGQDDFIERLSEDDLQIQLACCANRRFKQCVIKNAKQSCRPLDSLRKLKRTNSNSSQRVARKHFQRSMQSTMDDLKSTLDGMALTGPELICDKVDEHFCKNRFDGRFSSRTPKHNSIVPAMLKIYSNK